ncbi:MAG TPA: hypothetical protein VN256_23020 [Pyrinomonadaceae bacterium]|nr:hypothetical protein [Pyrinomonadaceae bacterium]
MPAAPYDEQNAADFREMTTKIDSALRTIEEDPKIPATEKELARLAGCSRGTLRYRAYPLQRLKNIKLERKRKCEGVNPEEATREVKTAEELLREEKATLQQQLHNSRTEVAIWVQKHQELKDEHSRTLRANQLFKAERQTLREENGRLKQRVKELEAAQGIRPANDVIIPFPTSRQARHRSVSKSTKKKTRRARRG